MPGAIAMNEPHERLGVSDTPSHISASMSSTNIKQGGSKLMDKLFGNKSATAKESSIDEINEVDEIEITEADEFPPGLITPCPFIRPLEHKLQARSEPMPMRKTTSFDTLCTGSSAFITMNREEANRILNNKHTVDEMDSGIRDMSTIDGDAGDPTIESATDLYRMEYQENPEDDIETQISQQVEYTAVTSAQDSEAVHHWRYYIQCYSKGQFNLNDPPQPPPLSSTFSYLPAVFSPQEAMRLSAARSFDVLWPQWSREQASLLIAAAMKEFDAEFASLSFFDGKYEILRLEMGYNASRIPRSISIAAHALLWEDVLVVSDTKKDWRFEGNPLVLNTPKIRFFAGAPMLSSDNQPAGVFAIFGREPRTAFTPAQRHALAGYGATVLKNLNQRANYHSGHELHSGRMTPLLQRDSATKSNLSFVDVDHALVPLGLRYHKGKTPQTNTPQIFLDRQLSQDGLSEQTPPSSSEGSKDDTFPATPRGFGKNHKQLSVNSDLSHISFYRDMITPDSESFRVSTPRPFSDSDLTSLNPHPPNTPVLLSQDDSLPCNSDLTVENFMSLSDNDCAEQESPLIDMATPNDESKKLEPAGHNLTVPASSRLTVSSISTMMTGNSHESHDPMAEAAFACSFYAQTLGYDLIYVVEIKPTRRFMTDAELFGPNGLHQRILVAYGLSRPMVLSMELHIRVLRLNAYQTWENDRATCENREYEQGYVIPLLYESSPSKKRSGGLVMGAFRRSKPGSAEASDRFKVEDEHLQRLIDGGDELRDILFKRSGFPRSPKRSKTEPASANGHFNDEASEVGKHPSDEALLRYPAGEAAEVGQYRYPNSQPTSPRRYLDNDPIKVSKHLLDETPDKYPAGEAVEVGQHTHDETTDSNPRSEAPHFGKPSTDSGIGSSIPQSPERKSFPKGGILRRLGKGGKAGKTVKAHKVVEVRNKYSLDAGLEMPFHSVTRFRPF